MNLVKLPMRRLTLHEVRLMWGRNFIKARDMESVARQVFRARIDETLSSLQTSLFLHFVIYACAFTVSSLCTFLFLRSPGLVSCMKHVFGKHDTCTCWFLLSRLISFLLHALTVRPWCHLHKPVRSCEQGTNSRERGEWILSSCYHPERSRACSYSNKECLHSVFFSSIFIISMSLHRLAPRPSSST